MGLALTISSIHVLADQRIQDDLIVVGSQCVGTDCVNGENFNFDTIRLKENNVRIKFQDTSSSSSFPTVDWQITANDSTNGGLNKFSIENIDRSTVPFTIIDGAPSNSIYVASSGYVGFGTSTPIMNLHTETSNSPTLRLEQNQGAGFAAQSWDIGGNETNFFIRDVNSGGTLPLRIRTGAPNSSIYVDVDGDIGFETTTPDGQFDVAHSSDANNHAFLISPTSDVGVNIDNGFSPLGLFDVQSTGGISRFIVKSTGNVGINTGTSGVINGIFDIKGTDATTNYFNVDNSGDIGIGTNSPTGRLEVKSTDGTTNYLAIDSSGNLGVGTATPGGRFEVKSSDGNDSYLLVDGTGDVTIPNDLTVTGTLNATVAVNASSIDGFSVLTTSLVETSGNLKVNGTLQATGNATFDSDVSIDGELTIGGDTLEDFVDNIASSKYIKNIWFDVDTFDTLDKVSKLEISQWSYKKDDDSLMHIGPMAEDFHDAFGLNGDVTDKIAIVDIAGVSLASIQALNTKLYEQNKEIVKLKSEIAEIKKMLLEIKTR